MTKGGEKAWKAYFEKLLVWGGDLIKGESCFKCLIMIISSKSFIFQNGLSSSKRGRMLAHTLCFDELNSFWKIPHYDNNMIWCSRLLCDDVEMRACMLMMRFWYAHVDIVSFEEMEMLWKYACWRIWDLVLHR